MIKRIVAVALLVTVMLLSAVIPVLAIADPDSPPAINGVYVFNNLKETGDTGVLIDYFLDYTATPNPTEPATDAYMAVFVDTDGATQLRTVAPYNFVDGGYGRGLIWIYFDATDTAALGITSTNSALYQVWLTGNPMLAWSASPPLTVGSIDYWMPSGGSANTLMSLKVLSLTDSISREWVGLTLTTTLIEETSSGFKLSTNGASYMGGAIPDLRTMAPNCYSSSSLDPTLENLDYSTSFGATMTNVTGAVTGSPITFATGNTTVVVTATGTFSLVLNKGTTGTITSGTGTVTGSPVSLKAGTNTVTFTVVGNAVVNVIQSDTQAKLTDRTTGTGFDLTTAATAFGMSRWMFSGLVWFAVSIIICAALYKTRVDTDPGITKVVLLLFDVLIIGGILLGLLHPIIGVLLFLGYSFIIGYVLFFQKSNV